MGTTVYPFTGDGSNNYVVPPGVILLTLIRCRALGGVGGAGATLHGGGGGGGGAFAQETGLTVTPGETLTVACASGTVSIKRGATVLCSAAPGGAGGAASITANGTAGTAGTAAGSVGSTKFSGAAGVAGSSTAGGVGGGGAGNAANAAGQTGGSSGGGTGGTGGTATANGTAGGTFSAGGGGGGVATGAQGGGGAGAGEAGLTFTNAYITESATATGTATLTKKLKRSRSITGTGTATLTKKLKRTFDYQEGLNLYSGDDVDFESGIGGWTASGGVALSSSTDQAFSGTHSLKADISTTGTKNVNGPAVAATVGVRYTTHAWVRAATVGRVMWVSISFYDSGSALISTASSGGFKADVTTGWIQLSMSASAPANTVTMVATVTIFAASPPEAHYIDSVFLGRRQTAANAGSWTAIGTVTITKKLKRTLSFTATGTVTLVRKLKRTLAATATGTATLTKKLKRLLSITGTGTITLTRKLKRTLSLIATGTVTLRRKLKRTLSIVATGVVTQTKRLSLDRTFDLVATGTVTLVKRLIFGRLLTMTANATIEALAKLPFRLIPGSGTVINVIRRFYPQGD